MSHYHSACSNETKRKTLKLHSRCQSQGYIFISYLLSKKFLNFLNKQGLILLDFKVFDNLLWVAANYKKNVTVIKNKVIGILRS